MLYPISDKIPTRLHYERVKQYLKPIKRSVIYVRGGQRLTRDDTDVELDFRQESNFFYLSGVEYPGYQLLILNDTEEIYLIPPTVSASEQLWKGVPEKDSALLKRYDVNQILSEERLPHFLQSLQPSMIYTLSYPSCDPFLSDTCQLKQALHEARLIKTYWEIAALRFAAQVSSHAHLALISHVASHPSKRLNESELESLFRYVCAKNGLRRQCYIPIVGSGPRAAVLHYTDNDQTIPTSPHALILVDAGGEHRCYGSDITRTFPVNGKYTQEAKDIYSIVLETQQNVLNHLKPGVYWSDMSRLAIQTLCQGLLRLGILKGGDVETLIKLGVYRAFYFHGLGHSIGIDCHDVGGKNNGVFAIRGTSLDTLQKPLEENMVITVEPGLYFSDVNIELWLKDFKDYFDLEKIEKYRPIGGVRIEDTVMITFDGHENFTIVPKEINDIEALMSV
ncbi:peptidase M24, structural domain-containing protein [Sporodiniella umbellata]|nr:peptidase M24, structural domain-containing protein [Sporodiniella umbellata]